MSLLRIDAAAVEWRASRAIVHAVVQGHASIGRNGFSSILLAAVLVAPLVLGAQNWRWGVSVGLGAGIPLALLALMWWGFLISSMTQQNHATSKLVPGLATRSLRLLVLAYVVVATVLTALFACAGSPVLPTLVGVCTVLTYLATMVVFPRVGMVFCAMLLVLVPLALAKLGPASMAQWFSVQRLAGLGSVFCLLTGWALLRRLSRSPWPHSAPRPDHLTVAARPANGVYARVLLRDCARADGGALLLHALGPQARMSGSWLLGPQAGSWLVCAMGLSGICLAFPVPGLARPGVAIGPLSVALCMALQLQAIVPHSLIRTFYRNRSEQSLVRLTPRAPNAGALNGVLGRALLRELALCWAGTSLLILALAFLLGASGTQVLRLVPACCLGIVASAMALRDYAARGSVARDVAPGYALRLITSLAMVDAALLGTPGNAAWWVIGVLVMLASAGWARHRWARMVASPPAFPAGRMP
ncbi:hypothetical protein [Massilia scottii]|uniref:hypothetical protein n=1 Tax=Massilia scottii TaxID=3057166 RepID=UPI002796B1FF|nr:hypothetical protein [Massilia sp. CCM 9029]MDQ1831379.1 hypothetical protein [Massilia sp. CCM 9029]